MTRLSPLLLALLFLTACASSVDSQAGAQPTDDRLERDLASMTEALDLTADQATRIRVVLEAQAGSRPSGPPPRGGQGGGQNGGVDRRGLMEAQRAETDRKIEAVLTAEQVDAFRAWRASQPTPQGPPQRGDR